MQENEGWRRVRARPEHPIFEPLLADNFYRIAQEAVTNALKHAGCRRIDIALVRQGQAVALTVADDGVGLGAAAAARAGLGLRTMRYRAARVGGVLSLHAPPGGGTLVRVLVPIATDVPGRDDEPTLQG